MKLLRIKVEGLPLFEEPLDITFYNKHRLNDRDKGSLYHLFDNIYLNCATALIGKNASGKTSILQVILLVINILNNEPINHIKSRYILQNAKEVKIHSYFFSENDGIYYLETTVKSKLNKEKESEYFITNEKLLYKTLKSIKLKKDLLNFTNVQPIQVRNVNEEFLPDDVSMIIAFHKKHQEQMNISSLLSFTNMNTLPFTDNIPDSIITFLDPTVETLYIEKKDSSSLIHLKFINKDEILLNSVSELELYLSSGTIKGITTFIKARDILCNGGYLLIDEIENHFNKEIALTIIRFFMDTKINKHGATLIYTTHYPELLDEYDRNDSIYITENSNGIHLKNLSDLLKRNDIKKSDAYQSGMIGETSPEYESYLKLKKFLKSEINGTDL